jgi:hypothetical protein
MKGGESTVAADKCSLVELPRANTCYLGCQYSVIRGTARNHQHAALLKSRLIVNGANRDQEILRFRVAIVGRIDIPIGTHGTIERHRSKYFRIYCRHSLFRLLCRRIAVVGRPDISAEGELKEFAT